MPVIFNVAVVYSITLLATASAGVFMAVIIVHISNKDDDEPMPRCLSPVMFGCLASITGMRKEAQSFAQHTPYTLVKVSPADGTFGLTRPSPKDTNVMVSPANDTFDMTLRSLQGTTTKGNLIVADHPIDCKETPKGHWKLAAKILDILCVEFFLITTSATPVLSAIHPTNFSTVGIF